MSRTAVYEVKNGALQVNGEIVPLRKGVLYTALVRAGWSGYEGIIPTPIAERMMQLDRRISLLLLSKKISAAL